MIEQNIEVGSKEENLPVYRAMFVYINKDSMARHFGGEFTIPFDETFRNDSIKDLTEFVASDGLDDSFLVDDFMKLLAFQGMYYCQKEQTEEVLNNMDATLFYLIALNYDKGNHFWLTFDEKKDEIQLSVFKEHVWFEQVELLQSLSIVKGVQ